MKIFTDGAARGNPGPGGWAAVIVLAQNNGGQGLVQEIGGREKHTTNNRMELTAVIESLKFASKLKTKNLKLKTFIYTDSAYVLNGATKWLSNWQKNKWKTATKKQVENQDLWKKLSTLLPQYEIDWKLLPGHSGIPANERCDEIATTFADGHKPKLYSGVLKNYGIDTSAVVPRSKNLKRKTKNSNSPAYSYVSLVDGMVMIHKTWPECEKRVKGVSGAKYKKVFSKEEENELVNSWT